MGITLNVIRIYQASRGLSGIAELLVDLNDGFRSSNTIFPYATVNLPCITTEVGYILRLHRCVRLIIVHCDINLTRTISYRGTSINSPLTLFFHKLRHNQCFTRLHYDDKYLSSFTHPLH